MNASAVTRAAVVGVLGALAVVTSGCVGDVVGGGSGGGGGEGGGTGASTSKGSTSVSSGSGGVLCWKDFGPDAPGECMIGAERTCPPGDDMGGTGYCREKCVNIAGKAVWGLKTYDFQCPYYES